MQKIYTISMGVEYDGSRYHGWQRQSKVESIQENLEKAISQIANESIKIYCAGRTDSGVHSTGQVIHFQTNSIRKDSSWTLGVAANLPKDITVRWIKRVSEDFHARFSAISRRYRYIIFNQKLRSAILNKNTAHYSNPLDAECMHRAAQFLIGENDFTSFRAKKCKSSSPWRNITHIYINRFGNYIIIDIQANSFLYHMVRNIVGSLIEVGRGLQKEKWILELLLSKDRTLSASSAKPEGLYLVSVSYPNRFNIPKTSMGPLFLSD